MGAVADPLEIARSGSALSPSGAAIASHSPTSSSTRARACVRRAFWSSSRTSSACWNAMPNLRPHVSSERTVSESAPA
ncbi:hypothetical protein [Nannocystis pusilla]|uniref:hypothetical protein n=1 Tax=Nannocystis pusilla TaxID=889268 RepID=UPI003B7EC23A